MVTEIGEGVESVAVGEEVIGWSDERSSQAEAVSLPADHVVPKPSRVPWEAAGSLYVAGTTAWATVKSVGLKPGEVVTISGAAGGVGSIATQLARRVGATVLGIAGAGNSDWLESMGVKAVSYGDGAERRVRAAAGGPIDAFIDCFGGGYVDLAVEELGVKPDRVDTIIDWDSGARHGTNVDAMSTVDDVGAVISELASLIKDKTISRFRLRQPFPSKTCRRSAYELLEQRHTRGKIVLVTGESARPGDLSTRRLSSLICETPSTRNRSSGGRLSAGLRSDQCQIAALHSCSLAKRRLCWPSSTTCESH